MNNSRKPLALITGGTGYVGMAIVSELLKDGFEVAVLSRTQKEIEGARVYVCDITNESDVHATILKIVSEYGTIRALIHAAAPPLVRKTLIALSTKEYEDSFALGVTSALYLVKAAVPHMDRGSVCIGITTSAIEPGSKVLPMGSYVPAKLALRGFLRVLATELAEKQIRVHAVAPGFLPGGLNSDLQPVLLDFMKNKSPEATTPEEVAATVADLCLYPNAFVTGTSIRIPSGEVSPL